MSRQHSIEGSAFIVSPLEKHLFVGDGFNCSVCNRPRALHRNDDFVPVEQPHSVCMDAHVRYGRHPYFWTPKSIVLNREEQARVDAAFSQKRSEK